MKKMILILVVVLMSLATSVSAQNYSEVMDNLRLEGLQTFGNNINGSWSYLNSGAGFKITDYGCRRSAAEGEAEGFGLLKADGEIKDDFLRLKSLAITKTSARQLKGDHGEIDLDGFVQRANYGTLEKGDNFITGWDLSSAAYNGIFSGPSPSGTGKAVTGGEMELTLTPTGSQAKITDSSRATIQGSPGQVDPSVLGQAGLASGNYVKGANFEAQVTIGATAAYSASDPRRTAGGLEITSNTNISQTPRGGISLKANITSKANSKTGPSAR